MKRTDNAKAYRERLLGDRVSSLAETDPEYIERFENFAFDEVIHQGDLDERTRMMAILAALLGCPGIDAFEGMVEGALNLGVTPVEIKEIVYQGTAYLGFGKVLPVPAQGQRCVEKARDRAAVGRTGDHDDGRPSGKGRADTGRYLWRIDARICDLGTAGEPSHQSLAFG